MCLGIPGRIVRIQDPARRLGTADVAGVQRAVNLAFVPDTRVGDWVLIHVGFAMAKLDEKQAADTLELLRQIGEAE